MIRGCGVVADRCDCGPGGRGRRAARWVGGESRRQRDNHHRFGGTRWDAWAVRLASAPPAYERAGITATIRYYTAAFEEVLSEWDAGRRSGNGPLFTLLDAVDEQPAAHHLR